VPKPNKHFIKIKTTKRICFDQQDKSFFIMKLKNSIMKNIFLLCSILNAVLISAQVPTIAWQKTYGGNMIDGGAKSIQTADGGYIVFGESRSNISGDKTVPSRGGSDIWILKMSSVGIIEWQKDIGGINYDVPARMIQTSDGGYLIGGITESNISGDITENTHGGPDYLIIKLDNQGTIEWQNTIGADFIDSVSSVIQTPDGGYLIGGSSISPLSGDKTENNIGSLFGTTLYYDYWVVKVDALGTIEWDNTIGSKETDVLYRVLNATDGGYILAGYSVCDPTGDYIGQAIGSFDLWIIKIDENGSILWQKTIGGNQLEYMRDIIVTSDGGYLIGATSKSNISGNKTQDSKGGNDYWLIKIDLLGNVLWDKTIGGNEEDIIYSLSQDSSNNFYIAGSSESTISGDKTENSRGGEDIWIVKTDESGTILWDKTIGGSVNDTAGTITMTAENNFLLTASSNSPISGEKTEASRGDYDFWLLKLEPVLATANFAALNLQAYPNPTKEKFQITLSQTYQNIKISIINMLGQMVQEEQFDNASKVNMAIYGEAGLYIVKLQNEKGESVSLKVVKE
jgi:hypothetical protein